jgi:hypothetical protein
MGLAEDLRVLEDLHQKGKLTDQEFADAKAKTLQKSDQPEVKPPKKRGLHPITIAMVMILLLIILAYWYQSGTRSTSQMLATAVHAPVTVADEVENVPANSWKAVAFTMPYGATLDISLRVVRGNPIDVFITTPDQAESMKKAQWRNVKVYGEFSAMKTSTYRRSGQLGSGSYYLVLRDTSLGILSQSASDVSLKITMNP